MKSETQKIQRKAVSAGTAIFDKLNGEKKKVITAVCLLTVMSLMWIKVFIGKSPQIAEASNNLEELHVEQFSSEQGEQGIEPRKYVELPKIEGRNDILTRDFFSFDNRGFYESAGKEVQPSSQNNKDEGLMRKISTKLTLAAIVTGDNPQAFINDKLFEVGDKLTVTEGSDVYECEVVEIGETEVTIRCKEGAVKLKILQSLEVLN